MRKREKMWWKKCGRKGEEKNVRGVTSGSGGGRGGGVRGEGRLEWVRVLGGEKRGRIKGEGGKGGEGLEGGQGGGWWHSWRSARLPPPHSPLNSFRPTDSYCLQAFISPPRTFAPPYTADRPSHSLYLFVYILIYLLFVCSAAVVNLFLIIC